MKDKKLIRVVMTALLAALVCVATMVIQIPSPMNGYVNLGDCVVLLCGWILGPGYGLLAAGIGSMLADIFAGYAHYAPGTFLIKGAVALVAALIPYVLRHWKKGWLARILGAVMGEIIMIIGYFGYACLFLGKGLAAASSIPGNFVQAAIGVAGAMVLYELLLRTKIMKDPCRIS